jgi:tripartite-type tricarboxylate transporter receptor subunit TctC
MHLHLTIAARVFAAAALATIATGVVAQQPYPAKPIHIIVPLTPGGSTDNIARLIASKLKDRWGQAVIVENRPGGNTMIGTQVVAAAAPDGYTLLVASNTHLIVPLLAPNMPFDAIKDFAPVATLASNRYVMLLNPDVPAKTLREFIAYAKANPGRVFYGSSGSGSGANIAGEAFNILTGAGMQHVPYKGGSQSQADVIGGHVQVSFNTPMIAAPYIKTGKLKGLAVSGSGRLPSLPQVPTFAEEGLPSYDEMAWQGLFAPAATPKPIVAKIAAEIGKILADPAMKEMLERQGVDPFISTPEQFAAMIKAESAKVAQIIKAAGIKLSM